MIFSFSAIDKWILLCYWKCVVSGQDKGGDEVGFRPEQGGQAKRAWQKKAPAAWFGPVTPPGVWSCPSSGNIWLFYLLFDPARSVAAVKYRKNQR
jgi:hypothetical protein